MVNFIVLQIYRLFSSPGVVIHDMVPAAFEAYMVMCVMTLLRKALVLSPVVFLQFEPNCLVNSIT